MKKLFFALVAMFMTMSASAQFGGGMGGMQMPTPEEMTKRQADQIKETCKINDDQYKKIYDYMLKEQKAMTARIDSIQKAGGDMMGMFNMEDMQKRQAEQTKMLKSVLTEEQFKAYQKAQEERMARFREMSGGMGGFGGGMPGGAPRQ